MIRVNDDYVVDTDPWNYILRKDLHRKEKRRDGSEGDAYRTIGYFKALSEALERLGEEIIKERLSVPEIGLAEACGVLRECKEEIQALKKTVKRNEE